MNVDSQTGDPRLPIPWKPIGFIVAALLAFALIAPAFQSAREYGPCEIGGVVESFTGRTMGTTYSARYVDRTCDAGPPTLQSDVDARLAEINRLMSTYDPESELSRFNGSDSTDWFEVSDETAKVVTYALTVAEDSGGAYDPTVGPVVNLWGFGPEGRRKTAPSDDEIDAARERVGYKHIEVRRDPPALRKRRGDVYLDLSSIAKGYGVDAVGALLAERGIESHMVEIGGEVVCRGQKPGGEPWRIGVEQPNSKGRLVRKVVELEDAAIATSGDYRIYFEADGERFSHTIDPATGRPVTHKLAAVSVIAPTCMEADALATALSVMGPGRGFDWAQQRDVAAYFIVRAGDEAFEELATDAWKDATSEQSDDKPVGKPAAMLQRAPMHFVSTKTGAVGAELLVGSLREYLDSRDVEWGAIAEQPFASAPLNRDDAKHAQRLLVEFREKQLKQQYAEARAGELTLGGDKMRFVYKRFGKPKRDGRSLFISMHGGGGTAPRVNDQQWRNQQHLYQPKEGIYVAPRAPGDTWDLWHEPRVPKFFDALIDAMVACEGVDPNRVYLMGYSAGGDGVYQLAPRMADRFAAAAMMAGHPNNAQADNLRNLGFAIFMGGQDAAYDRNKIAAAWGEKLAALAEADRGAYRHKVTIYPDKGHWMDRQDAAALPWMAEFTRDAWPDKIVWRQDGQPRQRFYWLGADKKSAKAGARIVVKQRGQTFEIVERDPKFGPVRLLLNDEFVNLDRPIRVEQSGRVVVETKVDRTIANLHESLSSRFDPAAAYSAVLPVPEFSQQSANPAN